MNVQRLLVVRDGGMLRQTFPANLVKFVSTDANVLFARAPHCYLMNSHPMPEHEKHNPQPRTCGSLCSQEVCN